MPKYRVLHKNSMQIPKLDDDGKPTQRNTLAVGGKTVFLPEADAKEYVAADLLELVQEADEPEPEEGSEVNGPGPNAIIGDPLLDARRLGVEPTGPTPETAETPSVVGTRPAKTAGLDKWQAAARDRGLDDTGTKAELQKRVEEFDEAQVKGQGSGDTK